MVIDDAIICKILSLGVIYECTNYYYIMYGLKRYLAPKTV